MHKYLSQQEVEEHWDTLIKQDKDLFIYSLSTNNLSSNWAFFFRNQILKLIIPTEVKIGNLEFNKKYCELISLRSKSNSSSQLVIDSVQIWPDQSMIPEEEILYISQSILVSTSPSKLNVFV